MKAHLKWSLILLAIQGNLFSNDVAECFSTLTGPDVSLVTDVLITLTPNQQNAAFNQMQPSQFSAITWTQLVNALLIGSSYSQHLENKECSGQWNFWAAEIGEWEQQKQDQNQFGYNSTMGGFTLGADSGWGNFCLGSAASCTYSNLLWKESAGDGKINSYYGGLYGSWKGESGYVNVSLLGVWSLYHTSRHLHFGTVDRHAKALHNSWEALGGIEGGIMLQELFCGIDLVPFACIDYVYLSQTGYSEEDAESLNLQVRQRNDPLLQSALGLLFTPHTLFRCGNWIVTPKLSLSYLNQTPLTRCSYHANFVGSDCALSVKGWDFHRNLCVVAFNLSFGDCAATKNITIHYDDQFGKNYWNQLGNIMYNFSF